MSLGPGVSVAALIGVASDWSDIHVRDQQVTHRNNADEVAWLPNEDMSDPAGHHLFGNFCHC